MRILYLINAFTYAGAEKLVCNLALCLSERVDYVGIMALYAKGNKAEKEILLKLSEKGIETKILGKRAGKDRFRSVADIYRFVKKKQIHIIHAHCTVPMAFGKIAGKLAGIPVICTIHNTKGYQRERMTSWMADAYISIGEAAEQYMKEQLKLPQNKIFRIYNAIDINKFKSGKQNDCFWNDYGGTRGEQSILNVGRVCSQKNQICLLRALRYLTVQGDTQVKLYILGEYEETDLVYQELKQYISDYALGEYVRFLGTHENVEDFLANADCFVMTSWYEGLSVAFLEAVISGCAVITTDLPFVQELNSISKCASVIPQNDAGGLADLLLNKNYWKQNRKTIEIFSEKFSFERFVEEHCDIYKNVRNRKK